VRTDERVTALADAYALLGRRHNALGITPALEPTTGTYYDRPAQVLMADRFADACLATVTDPALRGLPLIGSVDQVVDCVDVLSSAERCRRLAALYEA
jgi:hypothetical protein